MTAPVPKSGLRELVRRDGVGPVRCDGKEILRRIFVTVRDWTWREIAPTQWESEVDEGQRTATLTARHVSDSVDFEWKGLLRVSDDLRSLRFEITGQVLRDMEVCRLGLVVLHPVESLVDSQVEAIGPQGGHRLTVSGDVAPQPVVNGIPMAMTEPFSKLVVERSDFGRLELQFEGDLFELEDQRNWGDASFKSYCTPLRLGFPRALKAGTSIVHRLDATFAPTSTARTREAEARGPARARPNGRISDRQSLCGIFPAIGREWWPCTIHLHQLARQQESAWHHIHFDILGQGAMTAVRTLLESGASTKLQIGIETEDDKLAQELLPLLSEHRESVARLILYGPCASLAPAAAVEDWRRRLEVGGLRNVAVLAATRGYFVEFNRGAPLDAAVSRIAFPLTATVHSDDVDTIRDNVPVIGDMVDAIRSRARLAELAVVPLALYHPQRPAQGVFPRELVVPWLTATLLNTALARVTSVTLAEDVVDAVGPHDARTLSFLVCLAGCAGSEVRPLEAAMPSGLHAGVLRFPGLSASRILVANLEPRAIPISLERLAPSVRAATNAMTGDALDFNSERVNVPAYGVAWLE